MVNISNQYPQYYQQNVPFRQQQYQQGMNLPEQEAVNPPKEEKSWKKGGFIFGTWFGLNKLMDVFNNSCTKENYDKTIVGRLGNLGDKLSNKYGNTKIVKFLHNNYRGLRVKVKKFINNNSILSPMFNTPTKPENTMVLGFFQSQQHADLEEAGRTLKSYITELPQSLKDAGATKAEINALKAKYGKGMFGSIKNPIRAIQEFQFDKLGMSKGFIDSLRPEQIAEELKLAKLNKLGLSDAILEAPTKYEKEIIEACRRGGKDLTATFGNTGLYKLTSLFTKRKTNASMSYNKLIAGTKHTTKLGKAFAKMPKLLIRGLTFGGGKLNSLLVAFGLGTAFYNATKAPKEQKVGTAVAGGVDAVSWILAMPLAIKLMHGINGLKNIGRSKAEVNAHLTALKNFNKKVDAGLLTDKALYDAELKAVNALKNPKVPLKGFKKVLAKIGSCLSVALELPNAYKEASGVKGAAMRNIKRKLPNFAKNCVGYPLRFALYMMVAQPLVDKVISKITSSIFGKPYEPEEEKEKAEKEIAMNPNINTKNDTVNNPNFKGSNYISKPVDINRLPEQNLIKQYFEHKKQSASPYDTVPRSYIPQETPAPELYDRNKDLVEAALKQADIVQQNAENCLRGSY